MTRRMTTTMTTMTTMTTTTTPTKPIRTKTRTKTRTTRIGFYLVASEHDGRWDSQKMVLNAGICVTPT